MTRPSASGRDSVPSEPGFRFLAESIPHTVDGGPDGSTEYFNPPGTAYTGLPPDANRGWGDTPRRSVRR